MLILGDSVGTGQCVAPGGGRPSCPPPDEPEMRSVQSLIRLLSDELSDQSVTLETNPTLV